MTNKVEAELRFIFGRRSIRAYTPAAVSDASVRKMLEAAMAAPSAVGHPAKTKEPRTRYNPAYVRWEN